jgi:tripartite-type tricarboxylate transporter receptor subunit TctC
LAAASLVFFMTFENASAASDDVASFFRNKTMQMVIGFDVGGGYDLYGRLVARYLGKHVPGNPTIIPQNMPGAGSRSSANWLYNVAPKDGTAIGTFDQGSPLDQAMHEPGIQFDSAQFNWIGNPVVDNLVTIASRSAGVKSLADLKAKGGLYCGDVGAGPTHTFPLIINRLLNIDNKIVAGYPGVNAIYLAIDRGEVNCIGGSTWSSMKATRGPQLRNHDFNILLQWGTQKDPEIASYAGTDVPLSVDLGATELDRKALLLINSSATIGRPLAAPSGVPKERVEALRKAFDDTMKDPDFLAEAAKAGMVIKPLGGNDLQKLATEVARSPAEEVKRAEELTGLSENR